MPRFVPPQSLHKQPEYKRPENFSFIYAYFGVPRNVADRIDRAVRLRGATGTDCIDIKANLDKYWGAGAPILSIHTDYLLDVSASMLHKTLFTMVRERTHFPYGDIQELIATVKGFSEEGFETRLKMRGRQKHRRSENWRDDIKSEAYIGTSPPPDAFYYIVDFFETLKGWHLK